MTSKNNQSDPTPKNTTPGELTWQTYEYTHYQRSKDWYWLVGLLAVLGVIISLALTNFLLTVIILLGAFSVILLAKRPPEKITVSISNKGIRVKNSFFPFANLNSFAVDQDEPARLLVYTSRLFAPAVYLPLEQISPEQVRSLLGRYLPEVEYEESLTEKIMELIKF